MLTCREFIEEYLADYLDGALSPDAVSELEAHLAVCEPCVAYLNTFRKTLDVAGRAGRVEMPAEMQDILRNFVIAHLRSADR